MAASFDLLLSADHAAFRAELRLLDAAGVQIGYHAVDFHALPAANVQGLFNLRAFVQSYAARPGEATGRGEAQLVADLGVCLARDVLGDEIFARLAATTASRTLRVQLPGASEENDHLAAALARVPWEIARAAAGQPTLAERNLVVRAVTGPDAAAASGGDALALGPGDALRVLFIFAEAPGSRPLAARQERHALRELFEREIYPTRRVEADFLAHGVTRDRLTGLVTDRGGYHVVHWSGHGHLNLLELAGTDGQPDRLSGEDLVGLFGAAGGFIPRLFFLSACHSGDVLRINDWAAFQALAAGRDPRDEKRAEGALNPADTSPGAALAERPGYTGTAHALLGAGVPSVVAMRYAVGDDYARDLAVEFYRATLAADNPASVATGLNLARNRLRQVAAHDHQRHYAACDHATPVLYGLADPGLRPPSGRSPYKTARNPRLGTPIRELEIRQHPHFVGRTLALADLGARFIGHHRSAPVRPVALIQGIGGMGKTALAAEALDLWQAQFDWVLPFQAKPNALPLDDTLREVHQRLYGERKIYHAHVQANPADAIWRSAGGEGSDAFRGEARLDRLARNLVRAMRDEAILLVLDNFETNLKEQPEKNASAAVASDPLWACQDPAWDRLLALLAAELPGTASRVLLTCRRPLAALPVEGHCSVLLGPLPAGEAALYLRGHPGLRRLLFSEELGERLLARRVFNASRFHPLLLDRLARLAEGGGAMRGQLEEALNALEKTGGYGRLPELFAARAVRGAEATELAYLQDALEGSIDLLLRHAGADARLLLWFIALANDPVALSLLRGAWSGESLEQQQLDHVRMLLANIDQLPPEMQAGLKAMPPELRAALEAPSHGATDLAALPDLEPLLRTLVAVGLVTAERESPADDNPDCTCHELVRERIYAWIAAHPAERQGREENRVRLAYAERLIAAFQILFHRDMTAALEAGRRALVYCVQTGDHERLESFVGRLVTSTTDPRALNSLLLQLETAALSAPEGEARWCCLTYLADALRISGRPDASLLFYEQAVVDAKANKAWNSVVWINGKWANALMAVGHLDASRTMHLENVVAKQQAGQPQANIIVSELEAFRIDILQGRNAEVLPKLEQRLAKVESWWQRARQLGETVTEAPDEEFLIRLLIGVLDVAIQAHLTLEDWTMALSRTECVLAIKREIHRPDDDVASSRMNRANFLCRLGRYGEAQSELEACLEVLAHDPTRSARVLGSLACLFNDQGDFQQAVELGCRTLAMCEQLSDPQHRAGSHANLANYLEKAAGLSSLEESACHQLAALAYEIVVGLRQDLQSSIHKYAIDYRDSKAAGRTLNVPRLVDLLAKPAFRSLAQWLNERRVNPAELQEAIDHCLGRARQTA